MSDQANEWLHKQWRSLRDDVSTPEKLWVAGGIAMAEHLGALTAGIWDAINAKRPGCSWAANPWVWVIAFRRVEET